MNKATYYKKLIQLLQSQSKGEVKQKEQVEKLLASCWDSFQDSNLEGMSGSKLIGRMEKVFWDPPCIKFEIERHGSMNLGSTRANMQKWEVNINQGEVELISSNEYREKIPRERPVYVKPIAEEIANAVIQRKNHPNLEWKSHNCVKVLIGHLLPQKGSFKTTVESRRKRFRQKLGEMLTPYNWIEEIPHWYSR